MGQYYVGIIENKRGLKKFHPHNFQEGSKLMEHCYFRAVANNAAKALLNNPSKVYWVGDYSGPNDFCDKETYEKVFTLAHVSYDNTGEKPSGEAAIDWSKNWNLVNHTKHQFLNLNKAKDTKDALNPLVLLTTIGNGRGGGDYCNSRDEDMVGIWAGDLLEISEKVPEGYTEELHVFKKEKGRLLIITGPSGAGKTTISDILEKDFDIHPIVSYTTRSMRKGEVEGVSYHFVSREIFERIEMAERAEYNGALYGTSVGSIINAIANPGVTCVVVEDKGATQLERIAGKENVIRVYVDVSKDILRTRLESRGDNPANIEKRLALYEQDSNMKEKADYVISNDGDLEALKEQTTQILSQIG